MTDYKGLPTKLQSRCTARCRQGVDWKFTGFDDGDEAHRVAVFEAPACTRCGQRYSPQRVSVPLDWEPVVGTD